MNMSVRGLMIGSRRISRLLVVIGLFWLVCSAASVAAAGSDLDILGQPELRRTAISGPESTPTPTSVPRPLVPGIHPKPEAITSDGCCAYPDWSEDSEWILFFDAPKGPESAGLYGIPRAGGPATRITQRMGVFSSDWSLVAYPEAERVFVERWQDGERWTIPSAGRAIHVSPSSKWLAWQIGSSAIQNPDVRVSAIWISGLKGEDARELVTIHGGDLIGWSENEAALLVSGRLAPNGPAGIWRIRIEDGAGQLLFDVDQPREALLSTDGSWLAFIIAFETPSERNGVWLLRTDGGGAKHLDLFGSYRWRSGDQLVLVPLDLSASGPYLVQYDAQRDQWWSLTTPMTTQLPIANNDWRISPDGQWMVFQSYLDHNLYVMELPAVREAP